MLLEIIGGEVGKIAIDDEVRYADKYWRTKTAQMGNIPMVVTDITNDTEKPLTLYNSQNCEFISA